MDELFGSPNSILALGYAAASSLNVHSYASLLRICAPRQFYVIGEAFFFAIWI